jgi:two-component system, NarL family, response regulator DevR
MILCRNRLLRESIARIFSKRTDFEVIGAEPIGPTSKQEITESCADVLVLDSLSFVVDAKDLFPRGCTNKRALKCVLVAMDDNQDHFMTAVQHGVLGYVLQEASAVDVVSAIRSVATGEAVCPPRFAKGLFDFVASRASGYPDSWTRPKLGLTRREQQLVPLIGQGLTNKEIANQLGISEQTVKSHVHRILRKVGVEDRLSICETCQTEAQEF